ncbi:MAG: hypothetical protein ABIN97_18545, partial [Ginsengibacter sp.]
MNSSVILYKNKYFIGGLFIYIVALLYLHLVFQLPLTAFLEVFFIVGISFSCIAWVLTKNFAAPFHFPVIKKEGWLLLILVAWIAFYITYGGDLINKLIFKTWLNNPGLAKIIIFLKKLAVFVFIPFTVYKSLGFTLKDFGLKNNDVKFSDKKSILVLVVLSIAVLLFQYFLGNGSKPLRAGQFSSVQLLTALPLCFAYLLLDAGLIEEFFFRGLLQSRLSVVLKSPV